MTKAVTKIFLVGAVILFLGLLLPKTVHAADPCSSVGPNSITKTISRNPVELDTDVNVEIPFPAQTLAGFGPADIMLVLDTSGSMNYPFNGISGQTKLAAAKIALKGFVNSANLCLNRIGLAQYSWWDGGSTQYTKIVMNLSNDAAALDAAIDSLTADGGTSIGGGLHRGLEGLLPTAPGRRAGVDGYVVIATDGGQNMVPSIYDCWSAISKANPCPDPSQGTIIQKAIDMKVNVFTVGIGSNVLDGSEFNQGDTFNPVSYGFTLANWDQNACPYGGASRTWVQPTGPTICPNHTFDGEDYMVDLAKKTGGNYYYAPGACSTIPPPPGEYCMYTVYQKILNEITRPLGFTVDDVIDPRIFTGVDPATVQVHRIINSCDEATPANDITTSIPFYNPPNGNPRHIGGIYFTINGYNNWSLFINLGFIPRGEGRCVIIPTHVRADAALGTQPIDSPMLTNAECPRAEPYKTIYAGFCTSFPVLNPGWWEFVSPRVPIDESCLTGDVAHDATCLAENLPRMNIIDGNVTIIDPAKPWIKALGADVGSKSDISPIRRDLSNPAVSPASQAFNSEFLAIQDTSTLDSHWISAKNWLVHDYVSYEGINVQPAPFGGTDIYQGFFKRYSSRGIAAATDMSGVAAAASASGLVEISGAGNLDVTSFTYTGAPAVVFVPGNLTIKSTNFNSPGLVAGVYSGLQTGLVFVVGGNVTIERNVNQVDAYIVTNGTFTTQGDTTNNCDPALKINGGAVAYGQFILQRNLRCPTFNPNKNNPSEQFNFPLRYYWLFRDVIGNSKGVFREVAP